MKISRRKLWAGAAAAAPFVIWNGPGGTAGSLALAAGANTGFYEGWASPPHLFSQAPFWFWNDELSEREIIRQMDDFRNHGVYGGASCFRYDSSGVSRKTASKRFPLRQRGNRSGDEMRPVYGPFLNSICVGRREMLSGKVD